MFSACILCCGTGDLKFGIGHDFHVSNVLLAATSFHLDLAGKIPECSIAFVVEVFGLETKGGRGSKGFQTPALDVQCLLHSICEIQIEPSSHPAAVLQRLLERLMLDCCEKNWRKLFIFT